MAKRASNTNDASATDEAVPREGASKGGRPSKFDPLFAPMLVSYFRERYEKIEEVATVKTRDGLRHVLKPVPPPTLAGFAASIRVSRETIWRWSREFPEFKEAIEQAKAVQEDHVTTMAAMGAYSASFAALMMKNLSGWAEKAEVGVTEGGLVLKFDAQDELT